MEQGQLWNAGTVRIFTTKQATQRRSDQAKVADGRNRERMLRRSAAKLGMSVAAYQEHRQRQRERQRAEAEARRVPKPLVSKRCVICGKQFHTTRTNRVTCGADDCQRKHGSRLTSASIMRRYYADQEFYDTVQARSQARRAERLGLGSLRITLTYLLERDNWRCGICGKRIRSFRQASLDHIVPLSVGGMHVLENVQAAHRRCNYSKGNRGGGEQTRLIG